MNHGMEGLEPSVHHLGEARVGGDVRDWDVLTLQVGPGPARAVDLDPRLDQASGKSGQAEFVANTDQSTFYAGRRHVGKPFRQEWQKKARRRPAKRREPSHRQPLRFTGGMRLVKDRAPEQGAAFADLTSNADLDILHDQRPGRFTSGRATSRPRAVAGPPCQPFGIIKPCTPPRSQTAILVLLLAISPASADDASDWPRWRGPHDMGSTEVGTYPVQFDESTIQWKATLPGKGCSTPIVLERTIYLTAPVNGQDALLSFDWAGNRQWSTTFGPENAGKHRNGSGCNASPVTDGSGVFVYFKSGTLAAVELDGTVRWKTNLVDRFGKDERFWDNGTSPVLTDKHVVVARMHAGDSWLAAFDKTSGDLAWKVARNYPTPLEGDQCYTTPLVIQHGRQGSGARLGHNASHHSRCGGRYGLLVLRQLQSGFQ